MATVGYDRTCTRAELGEAFIAAWHAFAGEPVVPVIVHLGLGC